MSLELYGISEQALKLVLTFAAAVIPSLIVLAVTLRAGQSVAAAWNGLVGAIVRQMDEPAEQEAIGSALKISPETIDQLSHLLEALKTIAREVPAQEVTTGDAPK